MHKTNKKTVEYVEDMVISLTYDVLMFGVFVLVTRNILSYFTNNICRGVFDFGRSGNKGTPNSNQMKKFDFGSVRFRFGFIRFLHIFFFNQFNITM